MGLCDAIDQSSCFNLYLFPALPHHTGWYMVRTTVLQFLTGLSTLVPDSYLCHIHSVKEPWGGKKEKKEEKKTPHLEHNRVIDSRFALPPREVSKDTLVLKRVNVKNWKLCNV